MGPLFIPLLRRLKFGQQIRTEGPQGHLKKKQARRRWAGSSLCWRWRLPCFDSGKKNLETVILLVAALGYGLIGFLDDYIKILFKRSLGLTARQKLLGQLVLSGIVCFLLVQSGHSTEIRIPYVDFSFDAGWLYFPFVVFLMLGTSNAVNFTDGLDGLLAGTSAIAFGAYAVIALNNSQPNIAIFSAAMVGAVLGFLVFNAHPAKVFMGIPVRSV